MQAPVAFAKAIADETRFRVVHLLFEQSLCVCELAGALGLPQSTLSSHLQVIQRADLLDCEKRGKWWFYRVKPSARPLLRAIFRHFGSTAETDATLARDRESASRCAAGRDENCCPPPTVPRRRGTDA